MCFCTVLCLTIRKCKYNCSIHVQKCVDTKLAGLLFGSMGAICFFKLLDLLLMFCRGDKVCTCCECHHTGAHGKIVDVIKCMQWMGSAASVSTTILWSNHCNFCGCQQLEIFPKSLPSSKPIHGEFLRTEIWQVSRQSLCFFTHSSISTILSFLVCQNFSQLKRLIHTSPDLSSHQAERAAVANP